MTGKKVGGGGGPKVELNPKPKKIPILGQFGAIKKYIHIKHGTLKIYCFCFSNADIFKIIIAISFVILGITHFTLMLLIFCFIQFYRHTSQ